MAQTLMPSSAEPDLPRRFLPAVAAVVAVVALATAPAAWAWALALLPAVGAFALWSATRIGSGVLTGLVTVGVLVSQLSGDLELALFLLSLLGLVLTGWQPFTAVVGGLLAMVLAVPLLARLLEPNNEISWGIWMIGIAFPAFMGYVVYRQEILRAELDQARARLAEQVVLDERRRIARDVHDLVGHGLAAMMLQVTSARHVLRRDPDAAEEALETAENTGRQSLRELRRTVALLREGDSAVAPPPPGAGQVTALVEAARAGGLDVTRTTTGDVATLDSALGLVVYRVVQESLANASRYAPRARTHVLTAVEPDAVVVTVDSLGPLGSAAAEEDPDGSRVSDDDPDRLHYGVRGMRERAEAVGGRLDAGPTADGWSVRCDLPREVAGLATDVTAAKRDDVWSRT